MKFAVFGSRKGVPCERVQDFVEHIYGIHPDWILVSGGADGVDRCAETAWLNAGGQVISLRPALFAGGPITEDSWGIERWELGGSEPMVRRMYEWPTWATFRDAAFFRNWLIADEADEGGHFRYNDSPGTGDTIAWFESEEKPIYDLMAATE